MFICRQQADNLFNNLDGRCTTVYQIVYLVDCSTCYLPYLEDGKSVSDTLYTPRFDDAILSIHNRFRPTCLTCYRCQLDIWLDVWCFTANNQRSRLNGITKESDYIYRQYSNKSVLSTTWSIEGSNNRLIWKAHNLEVTKRYSSIRSEFRKTSWSQSLWSCHLQRAIWKALRSTKYQNIRYYQNIWYYQSICNYQLNMSSSTSPRANYQVSSINLKLGREVATGKRYR